MARTRIAHALARLGRDRSGAVAVTVVLLMAVMMGLLSLAVDVGSWFVARRQLQTAADAAALAGAAERARGGTATIVQAARNEAARNGFGAPATDAVVINWPPTGGPMAGDARAVEAVLTHTPPLFFAGVVLDGPPVITARAVASVDDRGEACVLALDPGARQAVRGVGNATVAMPSCTLAANSADAEAIGFTGNITLTAHTLWTPGGLAVTGNTSVTLATPATTGAWPLPDPYAGLSAGYAPVCRSGNGNVNSSTTLDAADGAFCGGLRISGNATITFRPGVYHIDGGDLRVQGNVTLRCDCPQPEDGVTFVFTNQRGGSVGGVDIRGNVAMTLRAPSGADHPFRGVLFHQDREASPGGVNRFNGNAALDVTGAMHFPAQEVQWSGNNSLASAGCVQIVARRVTFSGNAALSNAACAQAGARPITTSPARLSE